MNKDEDSYESLTSLETAKKALDKGLITQIDFDSIKEGFIAAQKIRAGIDAKLVREEDYSHNRDAFFELLGVKGALQKSSSIKKAQNTAVHSNPKINTSSTTTSNAINKVPSPKPAVKASPPTPPKVKPKPISTQSKVNAPAPPPPPPRRMPSKAAPKSDKPVSMSGISVDSGAVDEFVKMRSRSAYLWMTFAINAEGTEVILADTGDSNSDFEEFLAYLPTDECRYAVYDFYYEANEHRSFQKIVFFNWAPDTAKIKQKMMFASTKDFFKGILDGIQVEMFCTLHEDITDESVRDAVKGTLTRA